MEGKITLAEFWNSKKSLAIHCKTETEAIKLLEEFDKFGKRWFSHDQYTSYTCWERYRKNSCYDNINQYSTINYYKEHNYKIYEFEDVIFENKQIISLEEYLNEKQIEVLKEIKPICEAFGIKNYDYIINAELYSEILKLDNTYIGCRGNSIDAIINEVLSYIIIKRKINLGTFENQTIKYLKRYWEKDDE